MNKQNFIKSIETLITDVNEVKRLQEKTLLLFEKLLKANREKPNSEDVWLSVKETCKILKCSEVTLWKLRKEKLLAYSQIRRTIRFKSSDVYNYLNQTK